MTCCTTNRHYLEEMVHSLVADGRFCLALTDKILQILLKALLTLQEAHGDIIICFTVVQFRDESPENSESVDVIALKILLESNPQLLITDDHCDNKNLDMSSLAVEGLDIINVPEYGVLLAADLRRCIRLVCMLQVVEGKEVHIFYELRFTIYQLLDEVARNMKHLVRICLFYSSI